MLNLIISIKVYRRNLKILWSFVNFKMNFVHSKNLPKLKKEQILKIKKKIKT